VAHLVGANGLCEEEGNKGEGKAAGAAHDVVATLAGRSHALQQSCQPPSRQPIQRRRRLPQQPAFRLLFLQGRQTQSQSACHAKHACQLLMPSCLAYCVVNYYPVDRTSWQTVACWK
jgi:hypothetical protein